MTEDEKKRSQEVQDEMHAKDIPEPDFILDKDKAELWDVLRTADIRGAITTVEMTSIKRGDKYDTIETDDGLYFGEPDFVKLKKVPCRLVIAYHLVNGKRGYGRVIKKYIER